MPDFLLLCRLAQGSFPPPGKLFQDWVSAREQVRVRESGRVLVEAQECLLQELDYLHSNEVLHRDIKPSNIIISRENQPVLIDFGAAMLGTPPTIITLVGTPGYAAPEQFQPHGKVGAWSDLYALAHSFAKHISAQKLRSYPRSFVSSLQKAAAQDWEQRPTGAAEWSALLQKRPGRWWRELVWLICGGLLAGGCMVLWWPDGASSSSGSQDESTQRSVPTSPELPRKLIPRLNDVSVPSRVPTDTEAAVLTPDVIQRLQNDSPEEMQEQLQDLKRRQHARLQMFAVPGSSISSEGGAAEH